MSLDDTASTLWGHKTKALPLLVTAYASRLVVADLPTEAQQPFLALSRVTAAWWPGRQPEPRAIHDNEFMACMKLYDGFEPAAKMHPSLHAAYLQLEALSKLAPHSPPNEVHQVGEPEFRQMLRHASKVGRLPVAQLDLRLKSLLASVREPWPSVVARIERMSWVKSAPWGKLDKRLRTVASLADIGMTKWTDVGGRKALRVEADDTTRIAILTPEELASLRVVVPSVIEPA